MTSNTLLQAFLDSLVAYSEEPAIISAATALELSKRDGIKYNTYAIKVGTSIATDYEEDWRAEYEAQNLDIMCFVETSDTHTDRDLKYKLMLDMADKVRGWCKNLVNSDIDEELYYTKFIGVINTIDDQTGFYAQTVRIEYCVKQPNQ
jgi:hypothetical protein